MYSTILVVFGIFTSFSALPAENEMATQYIEKYRDLVVSEMERTNIPASIKMAQAMLESNMGRSTLATKANNHFGIKCNGSWTGPTYQKEDDDYRNGKLIKSCFRKYSSASSSFVAHSDFLMNQPRYGNLFDLAKSDYRGWAYGLKAAGYATDTSYPNKLINLIETYDLHHLDFDGSQNAPIATTSTEKRNYQSPKDDLAIDKKESKSRGATRRSKESSLYNVSELNKVMIVVVNGHVSLREIAKDQKIPLKDLKELNKEMDLRSTSTNIPAGEVVFLEKRKKMYTGKQKYHEVQTGEDMASISRMYGIDLEMLYIKNRMPLKSQPLEGEKIFLKGIVRLNDVPNYNERPGQKNKVSVLFGS